MVLGTTVRPRAVAQLGIRLARLLELPERDFQTEIRQIEADPLFARLRGAGVVVLERYAGVKTGARIGAWGLRTSTDGLGDLVSERGDLIQLIQKLGSDLFEQCFLSDQPLTDRERADRSGLSLSEARNLREFVDRLYVKAEFDTTEAPMEKVYSCVAAVQIEDGRPVLNFLHGETWKGRYRVDSARLELLRPTLPPRDRAKVMGFVSQLQAMDRRKSTLLQLLEALLESQRQFLMHGKAELRRPLTQREIADRIDVSPSVLNRLISNKSIRLPSGHEIAIKTLMPSRKALLRDRLYSIALDHPNDSDTVLGAKLLQFFGARLSRRSISQYRSEVGLARAAHRAAPARLVAA